MADTVKISALPVASSVNDTDLFPMVQGGITKQITGANLAALNTAVSTSGLALYLTLRGIPEVPDNVAGAVYSQDVWGTVDGWANVGAMVGSVSGGKLVLTTTSGGYLSKTLAYPAGSTIRIKARIASGAPYSANLRFKLEQDVVASIPIAIDGSWNTIDTISTSGVTTANIAAGSTATGSYVMEVEFIYIGSALYDTPAIDASGAGRHFTAYGCTPCDTPVGRGLRFDFTNDYLSLPIAQWTHTGAFSFLVRIEGKTRSAVQYILTRDTGAVGGRGIRCYVNANNRPQFIISADGTATTSFSADAGSECTSDCFLTFVFTPSTSMQIYKNGALIKENTKSIPALAFYDATQKLHIGAINASSTFDGWMSGAVLYDRALSAAEVRQIYNDGGLCIDGNTKAVSAVPYSEALRDSAGYLRANGYNFPATQVASTDVNTLDDYEEGTWTPGLTFGGALVSGTYSSQVGSYTKIGNRVFFSGNIILTSKGISTGNAYVTGLPFTAANSSANYSPCSLYCSAVSFADQMIALIAINTTTIIMAEMSAAGTVSALTNADFSDTSIVRISGHYYI